MSSAPRDHALSSPVLRRAPPLPLAVKSIRNLTGHSIDPYIIHAGKSVPIVASYDPDDEEAGEKMEEGEYFAIETFGSTGRGYVSGGVSSSSTREGSDTFHICDADGRVSFL